MTPGDQVKFIVDAQLPRGLCRVLDEAGYDAIHTTDLPEQNRTPDQAINAMSAAEERVVITKDTDFYYSHILYGRPYKLLLIRTGNPLAPRPRHRLRARRHRQGPRSGRRRPRRAPRHLARHPSRGSRPPHRPGPHPLRPGPPLAARPRQPFPPPGDARLSDRDASAILGAVDEQLPDLDVDSIPAPDIVPGQGQDWTVGRLLRFLQVVADAAGRDAEQLRAEVLRATRRRLNEDRVVYERLARQLQAVRRQRVLPQPVRLDHVVRYERHLNRELTQALAQLERVQRARRAARAAPRPSPRSIGADDLPPAHDVRHSNPISGFDPFESPARSR